MTDLPENARVTGDCWPWQGSRCGAGYGVVWVDGKSRRAHRVVYEAHKGPIPDGLVIDHLCRNRACVNPAHLEPVTLVENILRGEGWGAKNARKEACYRGHPFDDANTHVYPGRRVCRACQRDDTRERMRRLRAKRRAAIRKALP